MANTKLLVLSAALACLLVASQVVSQATPASVPQDELHYNGNNGDNIQLDDDTTIINDNTKPSDRGNQMRPNNQFGNQFGNQFNPNVDEDEDDRRPIPPSRPLGFVPMRDPFAPFNQANLPGLGGLFGPLSDGGYSAPSRPFSILDNLFGSIRQQSHNMHRAFERQFQDLERQAGEGQDVSYFNRNGVAYVRTCTTKRVSPSNDQPRQPAQILPLGQENQLEQNQGAMPQEQNQAGRPKQLEQSPQQSQPQQPQTPEAPKSSETTPTVQPSQTS